MGLVALAALLAVACGDGESRTDEPVEPRARVWVGELADTDAKVGFVHSGDEAVLFLCGGEASYPELTRWFSGTTALEGPFSFEAPGFRVEGELRDDVLEGTVRRSEEDENAWSAAPVAADTLAGLYSGEAPCGRVGLIVSQTDADDEPTGQGACVTFADGQFNVEQVNPVLPLRLADEVLRVIVASDPDREITVRPLAATAF